MVRKIYLILLLVGLSIISLNAEVVRQAISNQRKLKYKPWKQQDFKIEFINKGKPEASVKVIAQQATANGILDLSFKSDPKAQYEVSFMARGDAKIESAVWGPPTKITLLKPKKLNKLKWRKFTFMFSIPETAKVGQIIIYTWKQPGTWFEIKDYKLVKITNK